MSDDPVNGNSNSADAWLVKAIGLILMIVTVSLVLVTLLVTVNHLTR